MLNKSAFTKPKTEVFLLVLLTVIVLAFSWTGWLASDDTAYLNGARGWLHNFPYLGENHWEVRHLLVIPMAVVIGFFGESEFTVIITTTLYFLAVVVFTYVILRKMFPGTAAAVTVAGFLIVTPLFAVQATIPGVDIPEMFYVVLSLWLFHRATLSETQISLLFASGLVAGLAYVTREIAAAFTIFYAILFLVSAYMPRRQYLVIASGWVSVVITDYFYFWLQTGDPIYRFSMVYLPRLIRKTVETEVVLPPASVSAPIKILGTGNISESFLFGPISALFVNQEFALLYFFAIPAGWVLWRTTQLDTGQQRFLRLLIIMGIVWFIVIGYLMGNRSLPRYYSVPTYAAVVIVGVWISRIVWRWRPWAAVLAGAALVSTFILGIAVENRNPLFGERALARFLLQSNAIVHTDPRTATKALQIAEWSNPGNSRRIQDEPPPPDSLFLYNAVEASIGYIGGRKFDPALYRRDPQWQEIWRMEASPKPIGRIVDMLGLTRYIPASIAKKLIEQLPPIIVYKTGKNQR